MMMNIALQNLFFCLTFIQAGRQTGMRESECEDVLDRASGPHQR